MRALNWLVKVSLAWHGMPAMVGSLAPREICAKWVGKTAQFWPIAAGQRRHEKKNSLPSGLPSHFKVGENVMVNLKICTCIPRPIFLGVFMQKKEYICIILRS